MELCNTLMNPFPYLSISTDITPYLYILPSNPPRAVPPAPRWRGRTISPRHQLTRSVRGDEMAGDRSHHRIPQTKPTRKGIAVLARATASRQFLQHLYLPTPDHHIIDLEGSN